MRYEWTRPCGSKCMGKRLKEYWQFTSTDNNRCVASVLYERFPEMREDIAKPLKHLT